MLPTATASRMRRLALALVSVSTLLGDASAIADREFYLGANGGGRDNGAAAAAAGQTIDFE